MRVSAPRPRRERETREQIKRGKRRGWQGKHMQEGGSLHHRGAPILRVTCTVVTHTGGVTCTIKGHHTEGHLCCGVSPTISVVTKSEKIGQTLVWDRHGVFERAVPHIECWRHRRENSGELHLEMLRAKAK